MTTLQELELKKLELQLELLKLEAQKMGVPVNNLEHSIENNCEYNPKQPYFNKHLSAWILPSAWSGARWAKWLGFDSVEWPIDPVVVHQISDDEEKEETDEIQEALNNVNDISNSINPES